MWFVLFLIILFSSESHDWACYLASFEKIEEANFLEPFYKDTEPFYHDTIVRDFSHAEKLFQEEFAIDYSFPYKTYLSENLPNPNEKIDYADEMSFYEEMSLYHTLGTELHRRGHEDDDWYYVRSKYSYTPKTTHKEALRYRDTAYTKLLYKANIDATYFSDINYKIYSEIIPSTNLNSIDMNMNMDMNNPIYEKPLPVDIQNLAFTYFLEMLCEYYYPHNDFYSFQPVEEFYNYGDKIRHNIPGTGVFLYNFVEDMESSKFYSPCEFVEVPNLYECIDLPNLYNMDYDPEVDEIPELAEFPTNYY